MDTPRFEERMARMPALRLLLPFVCGILVAEHYTLPLLFTAGAVAVCAAGAVILRSQRHLAATLLFAGILVMTFRQERVAPVESGVCMSRIRLTECDNLRHTARGELTALYSEDRGGWMTLRRPVVLRVDERLRLRPDEVVVARTAFTPLKITTDYHRYLYRTGYRTRAVLKEDDIAERHPPRRNTLRSIALRHFDRLHLSGDAGAVVRALAIADRSALHPDRMRTYAQSGMSHLLALSGLHIAVIFLLLHTATRWLALFRHGHRIRDLLTVGLLWLFVAATGAPPSALRAAVMCTMFQYTLSRTEVGDGLNTLAAAALVMLTGNPLLVADPGFLMSFTAVAALVIGNKSLSRLHSLFPPPIAAVADMAGVGLLVSLAVAPLAAHIFGSVALWGIAANPVVIPLATAVVLLAALWMMFPFEFAAPLLQWLTMKCASLLDLTADTIARLPLAALPVRPTTAQTCAVYLLFIAMMLCKWYFDAKKALTLRL